MRVWLAVVALIAACHGKSARNHDDARNAGPSDGSASRVSGVPTLPRSDDGAEAMRALDAQIELAEKDVHTLVPLLLERAAIRGQLDDYERALREIAPFTVDEAHQEPGVLALVAEVQLRLHLFADARTTLGLGPARIGVAAYAELEVTLQQSTGQLEQALAARAARANMYPDAQAVTLYAATLAEAGRYDEAIAQIPRAAEKPRSNTPQYIAWLLFQWGRIYEQAGQLARARDAYEEAHRRLPAHVEVTEHLIGSLIATGDRAHAAAILAEGTPHPALLALAAQLADDATRAGKIAAASAAWDRYVTALPAAFSDHAARFYLGIGGNPDLALRLARDNLRVRDTAAARALAIEAALAAHAPADACDTVGSLATSGPRRERFQAWRALSACGRTEDAARLARELGF